MSHMGRTVYGTIISQDKSGVNSQQHLKRMLSCPTTGNISVLCREIRAAEAAKAAEIAAVKAKAQQLATALETIGVIRIPKKVRTM